MKMFRQHPLLSEWRSLPKEHQRELAIDIARDLRAGRFDPSLTLSSVVKETFQAVQSG